MRLNSRRTWPYGREGQPQLPASVRRGGTGWPIGCINEVGVHTRDDHDRMPSGEDGRASNSELVAASSIRSVKRVTTARLALPTAANASL